MSPIRTFVKLLTLWSVRSGGCEEVQVSQSKGRDEKEVLRLIRE